MSTEPLRQLLYASSCGIGVDVDRIVQQSRHNNAVDGITGLLWHDAGRFLQILEGPVSGVTATFARIAADPRHRDVRILSDRQVDAREFGYWSMEHGVHCADAAQRARLRRRLADAPTDIRTAFTAMLGDD